MALRAGYYGVKRWLWDKLQTMPNRMDATEAGLKTILNLTGSKNLYQCEATTTTDSTGVTWTVSSADPNQITISGTPSGFKAFNTLSHVILSPGKYILSGAAGVVNATFNSMVLRTGTTLVRDLHVTSTNTFTFEILDTDVYDNIFITLKRSANDVACSGTFKLMIRPADIVDDTYVPFAETNYLLTKSLNALSLEFSADLSDHKDVINEIISAATGAADFAAFKTAMAALTPLTRSAAPAERSLDVEEDEPVVVKKTTRKKTTKTEEEE